MPSPANPPKGCNFCTRCPAVIPICKEVEPTFKEHSNGHFAACHLLEDDQREAGKPLHNKAETADILSQQGETT